MTLNTRKYELCRTPDENFGILLEAAVMYDRRVAARLIGSDTAEISEEQDLYPNLLFIITGKYSFVFRKHK